MNKRKLRRVAIVALVLVLLCNTLGVQASTKKDDPTVIDKLASNGICNFPLRD